VYYANTYLYTVIKNKEKMKGTEKQIRLANELLNEYVISRVEKLKERRPERVKFEMALLEGINEDTDAGKLIDVCNNLTSAQYGWENGKTTIQQLIS
jgi:adenine C2-methylase RlmN of 23S rRNA A2503 and tRNA A37